MPFNDILVKKHIDRILCDIGIFSDVKGYKYFYYAIFEIVQGNLSINNMYPKMSEKFGIKSSSIDRAMRRTLDFIWHSTDPLIIDAYFNIDPLTSNKQLSIKDVVKKLAEYTKIHIKIQLANKSHL